MQALDEYCSPFTTTTQNDMTHPMENANFSSADDLNESLHGSVYLDKRSFDVRSRLLPVY